MMSNAIKEKQFIDKLYEKLTHGDIESSLQVYNNFTRIFNDSDFIEKILKPVMERIEDDLTNKKINVATERVAKNVATTLAKIITDRQKDNA